MDQNANDKHATFATETVTSANEGRRRGEEVVSSFGNHSHGNEEEEEEEQLDTTEMLLERAARIRALSAELNEVQLTSIRHCHGSKHVCKDVST